MTPRSSLAMSALTLALFAACSSAPAETSDDTSADAMKETKSTMNANALGPISLYFGDKLAASVDADGRFLTGAEAAEPGKHVATFAADGTLTFVDEPEMKMVLAEDGTISMVRDGGMSETVPIAIGANGSISPAAGDLQGRSLSFDAEGRLTSAEPLPDGLANTRMEGYSKVPPRHAAYVFVVTSMFTVASAESAPPAAVKEPSPAMEEIAPAADDADVE